MNPPHSWVKRTDALAAILVLCFVAGAVSGHAQSAPTPPPVIQDVSGSLIALSTPNVSSISRWYQEKLGFRPVKEGELKNGLRFALLRFDDHIVELIQNPKARPLSQAVPGINDPFEIHGIFKLGFTVRHLDAVSADLQQRGTKLDFGITQLNDLGLRAFGVRDLDGNLIQFFGK
jgi:catechol 2,3-dioxygenase-like lactoylglutathione lyase family enzyme